MGSEAGDYSGSQTVSILSPMSDQIPVSRVRGEKRARRLYSNDARQVHDPRATGQHAGSIPAGFTVCLD